MTTQQHYYFAVGRRKSAIAQVRLTTGSGNIIVDGKPYEERFPVIRLQHRIQEPLTVTGNANKVNAMVKVVGGGIAGQADAVRHGLARALVVMDQQLRPALRKAGLLTRDPRVKERKKYGLKRARKAPQYTKR
ncbi:MAG: 30S ribosomal protein S9 [Chloroflexi bacterium]|nr:30S ribosomal protein S9 [Chloroflexota bacterium]MBI4201406.1 30S ribosomal protein S9 [Chloroflexota bacterium]